MARVMPFPTANDIIENPSLLLKLPGYYVADVMEQIRRLGQLAENTAATLPPTPVDFALLNPRYSWLDARHLHHLGERLALAIEQSESGEPAAVLVNMPPRHAKSTICSVWLVFWYLARFPERRVFLVSHSDTKAREWGITVRRLVEIYGKAYGLELDPKKSAANDWSLVTGGGMKTAGWGGSVSGNMVHLFILDDLLKDDAEARSPIQRDNLWSWWENTATQRIEAQTTTIVIGTRYHEDDYYGRLLRYSASGEGVHFEHLTLTATAEDDDVLGRAYDEGLWTSHAGWGQKFYDRKKATTPPYTWNAVYQQRPSSPDGNIVDPSWFRWYLPHEKPRVFEGGAQSWDLSLDAEKKTDSYHAGLVAGRVGALIYIEALFHEHCASTEVVKKLVEWDAIYPHAKTKLVERAIAGPFMVQMLRTIVGGLYLWPPKGKQKGSKQASLEAAVPIIMGGNVLLPLNADGTKPRIFTEFLEELRQFPRAPHDDFVDIISQLLNFMFPAVAEGQERIGKAINQAVREMAPTSLIQRHDAAIHKKLLNLAKPKLDAMRKAAKKGEAVNNVVLRFAREGSQAGVAASRTHNRILGGGGATSPHGARSAVSGMQRARSSRRMW